MPEGQGVKTTSLSSPDRGKSSVAQIAKNLMHNIFSTFVVHIKKKSIFADRLKLYFNVKNKSI